LTFFRPNICGWKGPKIAFLGVNPHTLNLTILAGKLILTVLAVLGPSNGRLAEVADAIGQ